VVFGEALFDCFPDGRRVLGGAPFNVAWHLHGFGRAPVTITRIGRDESGREITARMAAWGMTARGLQVDDEHATGRVSVNLVGGEPAFEIEPHQAYDYIAVGPARSALDGAAVGLVYHGTLALRAQRSWETFLALSAMLEAPTLCDVNLRAPWWTADRVGWCLRRARWAKVNGRELEILTQQPTTSPAQCDAAAAALAERYGIETVIVTRGAGGAMLLTSGKAACWEEAPPVDRIADTVGAGDAFSAVAITGLLEHWEPAVLIHRAVRFAAEICTIPGATTNDAALYRRHRHAWENHGTT
jgi:fructokinase